jgi:hypothetical protein
VYDLLGKELKTLVSGDFPGSGTVPYQASWDGSNASGGAVASGVYICRFEARGQSGTSGVRTVKMMLVR